MGEAKKGWTIMDYAIVIVCAALFGGANTATGFMMVIPGCWLRPGNGFLAPFGMLFGWRGALGCGIGNIINDIAIGIIGPTLGIPGFIANLGIALIMYYGVSDPGLTTRRSIIEYYVLGLLASFAGMGFLGLQGYLLGTTPATMAIAFTIVAGLNNVIPIWTLGAILCKVLYPYVRRAGYFRGREVPP